MIKKYLLSIPGISYLNSLIRQHYTGSKMKEPFYRGHYYSPLPDIKKATEYFEKSDRSIRDLPGINLQLEEQKALLKIFQGYYSDFKWPQVPCEGWRYYTNNLAFTAYDAFILYAFLRYLKPKQIIEVGSGFSSSLMLDVNDRFLEGTSKLTFIEPRPADRLFGLLRTDDQKKCSLITSDIQDVPNDIFAQLQSGDILFVDSSHTSRIGSDVNHIIFEILPTLNPGVFIHFHDIHWPFEYRREWIVEGKAWNEAYLLRAFLMDNMQYKVRFYNRMLLEADRGSHQRTLEMFYDDKLSGSFWLEKTGAIE